MPKTYEFVRKVNGHRRVVAEVVKYDDGSATAETQSWGGSIFYEKADAAFAAVRGWVQEMDGCNGFND